MVKEKEAPYLPFSSTFLMSNEDLVVFNNEVGAIIESSGPSVSVIIHDFDTKSQTTYHLRANFRVAVNEDQTLSMEYEGRKEKGIQVRAFSQKPLDVSIEKKSDLERRLSTSR